MDRAKREALDRVLQSIPDSGTATETLQDSPFEQSSEPAPPSDAPSETQAMDYATREAPKLGLRSMPDGAVDDAKRSPLSGEWCSGVTPTGSSGEPIVPDISLAEEELTREGVAPAELPSSAPAVVRDLSARAASAERVLGKYEACDLRNANFFGAHLRNANFNKSDLRGADFRRVGIS